MGDGTKVRLIKIGNSRGIRIPKIILDQVQLGDNIVIEVQKDRLIIRQARTSRQDWDKQFREMAVRGDDKLLDSEVTGLSNWDRDEWEW